MLLAIDPGGDSGWALFEGGKLVRCGLARVREPIPGVTPTRVLIELTTMRLREKNPQAILTLGVRAGEWGGIYREHAPEYLTPNDWKGSTPKSTSHARILRTLSKSPSEHLVMEKGTKGIAMGLVHNVLDAIGIGLHGVGRNANGR